MSVSDLRFAEEYYRDIFGMEVLGRESWEDGGEAYSLPADKGWDDAEAAGVELRLVALRRDEVTLALLAGEEPAEQIYAIGLLMDAQEIAAVRSRVPAEQVAVDSDDYLEFLDPFGLRWQVSTDRDFAHAGQIANRWLDV